LRNVQIEADANRKMRKFVRFLRDFAAQRRSFCRHLIGVAEWGSWILVETGQVVGLDINRVLPTSRLERSRCGGGRIRVFVNLHLCQIG
jgi:hypothetical protein